MLVTKLIEGSGVWLTGCRGCVVVVVALGVTNSSATDTIKGVLTV